MSDDILPDENAMISNYEDVESLRRSLIESTMTDQMVPGLLFVIIKQGS